MYIGFHMKYELSPMLDVGGSQLACAAACASKIWIYGAVGLPAESINGPWTEDNSLLKDIIA